MDCYTEKVIMEHIEGCPGSQYKMKVVLVPGFPAGQWDVKCLCSNKQNENGHDIWFDAPRPEADEMLIWAIRELSRKQGIIK